jgi:DNA polymerase elongation subunit (family B)
MTTPLTTTAAVVTTTATAVTTAAAVVTTTATAVTTTAAVVTTTATAVTIVGGPFGPLDDDDGDTRLPAAKRPRLEPDPVSATGLAPPIGSAVPERPSLAALLDDSTVAAAVAVEEGDDFDPAGPWESPLDGDGKAAEALRAYFGNYDTGLPGFALEPRWQQLHGTVVHEPTEHQLPQLRPSLRLAQLPPDDTLLVGVTELVHYRPPRSTRQFEHSLWLLGVTAHGVSVALHLQGFEPSFLVALPPTALAAASPSGRWSPSECAVWVQQMNRALSPHARQRDSGEVDDSRVQRIVSRAVAEWRTPLVGFTNERSDVLLRVYLSNAAHLYTVRGECERRAWTLYHDAWPLSHQFIHRSGADALTSVRVGRWVRVARSAVRETPQSLRVTRCQVELTVPWAAVRRDPSEAAVPILSAKWDGEMLSQEGYDLRHLKVDKFPVAAHVRDAVLCLSLMFNVVGYGGAPFLRVLLVLHSCDPLPGVLVFTFDTERALMLACYRLVLRCDLDDLCGYNTVNFDMPYLFTRAIDVLSLPEYRRLGRFVQLIEAPNERSPAVPTTGRWQVDFLPIVQKQYKYDDYSLRAVCASLVKSGVSKMDLPYRHIPLLFHEGGARGRARLACYCACDAVLPLLLDADNNFTAGAIELATLANLDVTSVVRGGEQKRLFGCIMERAHRNGWYINDAMMKERACYRRPALPDWNGYSSPNNELHVLLSQRRAAGQIEPDTGFVWGDPRAVARDDLHRLVLWRNFTVTRPDWRQPLHGAQLREWETYCREIMYPKQQAGDDDDDDDDGVAAAGSDDDDDAPKRRRQPVAARRRQSTLNAAWGVPALVGDDGEEVTGSEDSAVVLVPESSALDLSLFDHTGDAYTRHLVASNFTESAERKHAGGEQPDAPWGDERRGRHWHPGDRSLAVEGSQGGCVFRPLPGVYDDLLITTLDFASLYPSVLEAEGYCYSSLVWDEAYANVPGIEYVEICHMGYFYRFARVQPVHQSAAEFAANRNAVASPDRFRTLLPELMRALVANRRLVKAEMETEKDPFRRASLDVRQAALKVVCNAAYGFLNVAEHMSYLSCPPLAFAVTSTGRDMIRLVKSFVEQEGGGLVVYGDTDSVMTTFPRERELAATRADYEAGHLRQCTLVCALAARHFRPPHKLENEYTMDRALFAGKKAYTFRYAGTKKFKVVGLGSVRRNYPPMLRELTARVQSLLLEARVPEAVAAIDAQVTELVEGRTPLERLAISAAFNPATSGRLLLRPFTLARESARSGVVFNRGDRIKLILRRRRHHKEKPYECGVELRYAKEHGVAPDLEKYFADLCNPLIKVMRFQCGDVRRLIEQWRTVVLATVRRQSAAVLFGGCKGATVPPPPVPTWL